MNIEQLLNIVTDLSAEAVVSIEKGYQNEALNHLEVLQQHVDNYVQKHDLRQVTEEDHDFDNYFSKINMRDFEVNDPVIIKKEHQKDEHDSDVGVVVELDVLDGGVYTKVKYSDGFAFLRTESLEKI